jgi:hypothetical protein
MGAECGVDAVALGVGDGAAALGAGRGGAFAGTAVSMSARAFVALLRPHAFRRAPLDLEQKQVGKGGGQSECKAEILEFLGPGAITGSQG